MNTSSELNKIIKTINKSEKKIEKMYYRIYRQLDDKLVKEFYNYAHKYRIYESTKKLLNDELLHASEEDLKVFKQLEKEANVAFLYNITGDYLTEYFNSLKIEDKTNKYFTRFLEAHTKYTLEHELYINRPTNDSELHNKGYFLRLQNDAMRDEIVHYNTLVDTYNNILNSGRNNGEELAEYTKLNAYDQAIFSNKKYQGLLRFLNAPQEAEHCAKQNLSTMPLELFIK